MYTQHFTSYLGYTVQDIQDVLQDIHDVLQDI